MEDMDYLRDPEMWEDKLPQPYKTINRILRKVLEKTWLKIEEREIARTREEARVKIPTGAIGVLLHDRVLVEVCGGIVSGDNSLLVVGNGTTVCVLRCQRKDRKLSQGSTSEADTRLSSQSSDVGSRKTTSVKSLGSESAHKDHLMGQNEHDTDVLGEINLKYSIIRLEAQQRSNGGLFIMVQLNKVIKILVFFKDVLTEIMDIQYLHKERPSTALNFSLASHWSHLAVSYHCPPATADDSVSVTTTSVPIPRSAAFSSKNSGKGASAKPGTSVAPVSSDDGVIIALYSLPVDEWMSDVCKNMEQTEKSQEITFSRPPVLYYITPPLPLTPCSNTTGPSATFQSVCEEKSQTLPSGDLHCLTEQCLENRWKHFVGRRQGIMPIDKRQLPVKIASSPPEQYTPTCYFLHHRNGLQQDLPCGLALWWEKHSQLIIYPVKEGGKLPTLPPAKRIHQTSVIMCSSISADTSMLALGLKNGVLAVWNMKTNFCVRVIPCTKPPDEIIALEFFFDEDRNHHVGVGTKQGKLLDVSLTTDDKSLNGQNSVTSFNTRSAKQQLTYNDMFDSNEYNLSGKLMHFITDLHYPNLLVSLQENGCVVFWNPSECEALCKFELENSGYSLVCPPHCNVTVDGKHLLLCVKKTTAEYEEDYGSYILCIDIFSVPQLAKFLVHDEMNGIDEEGKDETLLKPVELLLDSYNKSRYIGKNDCSTIWMESWASLSKYLLQEP